MKGKPPGMMTQACTLTLVISMHVHTADLQGSWPEVLGLSCGCNLLNSLSRCLDVPVSQHKSKGIYLTNRERVCFLTFHKHDRKK